MQHIKSISINGVDFFEYKLKKNDTPKYVFHHSVLHKDYRKSVFLVEKIGGKKYRGQWFSGGLVVETDDINKTAEELRKIKNNFKF